jgi:hypothetical protein
MVCGLPVLTEVEDVCASYASGKHHRDKFDKKKA